ncbi:hypothetical protein RRG08_015899 [Elysia crispata]|uniref:Uncharacterized protein n=1 Tax=Elysia crispata TaxID=231223 RepID=A0AAE1AM42_9GAST|nr:hypothetical protein RRG08_015899 [Elysia crispata]
MIAPIIIFNINPDGAPEPAYDWLRHFVPRTVTECSGQTGVSQTAPDYLQPPWTASEYLQTASESNCPGQP